MRGEPSKGTGEIKESLKRKNVRFFIVSITVISIITIAYVAMLQQVIRKDETNHMGASIMDLHKLVGGDFIVTVDKKLGIIREIYNQRMSIKRILLAVKNTTLLRRRLEDLGLAIYSRNTALNPNPGSAQTHYIIMQA